jgi:DNA-binding SARP family transcriptional activator
MSSLTVCLLGRFEPFDNGDGPLPLPAALNARSSLAYLILPRIALNPASVWPTTSGRDRPEERARRSLSIALWHVRRCLSETDLIPSGHRTIQPNPKADPWLDAKWSRR